MRKLLITVSLCLSGSLFAQGDNIRDAFRNSDLVDENVSNLERVHFAKCSNGKVRSFSVGPIRQVSYASLCISPGSSFKIKIQASYKNKQNPVFKLSRIKVKKLTGYLVNFEDEQELVGLRDPFIQAYKNSATVRKLRHLVEDSFQVVCRSGRANRGGMLAKSTYSYDVACKASKKKVKLSVNSKVSVMGEDTFRFNLQNYQIKF
jgi:hypothetical protein